MAQFIAQNMAPIMFASLVVVLLLGYPVAFSLAAVGLFYFLIGVELAPLSGGSISLDWNLLAALPERVFGVMNNDTLLAIPFFTFMGLILERSGMAEDLLDTIGQLFGPVRGGLAYAVIFVGALLAATTGVVAASVIAMGLISLPIMLRYGYDRRLASGVIAASGTLAQIIPPSLVLIVLADQLGRSVGDMYQGAIVPGLILTVLYMGYVLVITTIYPASAPALPAEARSFGEGAPYEKVMKGSLLPLALVVWGMILLFDPASGLALFERYLPFVAEIPKHYPALQHEPWLTVLKAGALVVIYFLYVWAIRFLPVVLGKLVGFAVMLLGLAVAFLAVRDIGAAVAAVGTGAASARQNRSSSLLMSAHPQQGACPRARTATARTQDRGRGAERNQITSTESESQVSRATGRVTRAHGPSISRCAMMAHLASSHSFEIM